MPGHTCTCTCTPNNDEACKRVACGQVINNCQKQVDCNNTCKKPEFCTVNTCRDCDVAADCPGPNGNVCAKATCIDHVCGYGTVTAGTTCPGGTCSKTFGGVCERPAVNAGGVSIDATEVTRGQYYAFMVDTDDNTGGQTGNCVGNGHEPAGFYPRNPRL